MSILRRIFPSPLLSVLLLALWIVLARSASPGQVLLGIVLAIAAPILASPLRLTTIRVRQPLLLAAFMLKVGYDVVLSNIAIALDVLRWQWQRPRSAFVVVPLELRDPLGLTALAMVATTIPGTVWSELAADGSCVLLHVWDVPDDDAFVARFKARYEQPLREIFE